MCIDCNIFIAETIPICYIKPWEKEHYSAVGKIYKEDKMKKFYRFGKCISSIILAAALTISMLPISIINAVGDTDTRTSTTSSTEDVTSVTYVIAGSSVK